MYVELIERYLDSLFSKVIKNHFEQRCARIPIFFVGRPGSRLELEGAVPVPVENDRGRGRLDDVLMRVQRRKQNFFDLGKFRAVRNGNFDDHAAQRHRAVIDERRSQDLIIRNENFFIIISNDLCIEQPDILHKSVFAVNLYVISFFKGFGKYNDNAVRKACQAVLQSECDGERDRGKRSDDARGRKAERTDDDDHERDI